MGVCLSLSWTLLAHFVQELRPTSQLGGSGESQLKTMGLCLMSAENHETH